MKEKVAKQKKTTAMVLPDDSIFIKGARVHNLEAEVVVRHLPELRHLAVGHALEGECVAGVDHQGGIAHSTAQIVGLRVRCRPHCRSSLPSQDAFHPPGHGGRGG